jgi:hypothetical protein
MSWIEACIPMDARTSGSGRNLIGMRESLVRDRVRMPEATTEGKRDITRRDKAID